MEGRGSVFLGVGVGIIQYFIKPNYKRPSYFVYLQLRKRSCQFNDIRLSYHS